MKIFSFGLYYRTKQNNKQKGKIRPIAGAYP